MREARTMLVTLVLCAALPAMSVQCGGEKSSGTIASSGGPAGTAGADAGTGATAGSITSAGAAGQPATAGTAGTITSAGAAGQPADAGTAGTTTSAGAGGQSANAGASGQPATAGAAGTITSAGAAGQPATAGTAGTVASAGAAGLPATAGAAGAVGTAGDAGTGVAGMSAGGAPGGFAGQSATGGTAPAGAGGVSGTAGGSECGNARVENGEQCEIGDTASCTTLSFDSGELSCGADCQWDTTACGTCGDESVGGDEDCDGPNLAGTACTDLDDGTGTSQNFLSGDLACDAACAFDTSACRMCAEAFEAAPGFQLTMIVVLDRSGSMSGSTWTSTVAALTQYYTDPNSAAVEVAMSFFPRDGATDACNKDEYNPPHVPPTILGDGAQTLVDAMNAQSAEGATTPIYGALWGTYEFATAYQDLNPTHKVIVVLATDGDPNSCPDDQNEIPVIGGLAASAFNYNGVVTHAIAIEGATVSNLNQIVAPSGGTVHDVTSDITLFSAKMAEIQAAQDSCEYVLTTAAASNASNVNVYYTPDGANSPVLLVQASDLEDCGRTPAWYFDSPASPSTVHLCPSSCGLVSEDPSPTIEYGVGCPTVLN